MYDKFLKGIQSVKRQKTAACLPEMQDENLIIIQGGFVKVQAIRTIYWSGASRPVWFKKTCHF